jgi:hypothetical protein
MADGGSTFSARRLLGFDCRIIPSAGLQPQRRRSAKTAILYLEDVVNIKMPPARSPTANRLTPGVVTGAGQIGQVSFKREG